MDIKVLIQEIRNNLNETDDLSVLADWDTSLSAEFAFMASELAEIKRKRAETEILIKANELRKGTKVTETEVERLYFATREGSYLVYAQEMLKGIAKLISAVRFKRQMLNNPLNA